MDFKQWLLTEADARTLYDACRWVTALSANLGYLSNDLHNNSQSVPENLRKNAMLVSKTLQATAKASDAIMGTQPGQGRGDLNWIETNRQNVEALLAAIVDPLSKLLPLVPPNMGKIVENGQKVLAKINAAGINNSPTNPSQNPNPNQNPQNPEPISVKKLEFDYRMKPGTLDIQMLPKTGMVSVRNRVTGKVVSVKPDRKSIEDAIPQIM